MCFPDEGDPITYKNLLTPEQQALFSFLGPQLAAGARYGATPFPGQLSAPADPTMMRAMNTMSNIGGYGNYNWPGMKTMPFPKPQQVSAWGAYDPAYYGGRGAKDRKDDGKDKKRKGDTGDGNGDGGNGGKDGGKKPILKGTQFDPMTQYILNYLMSSQMQPGGGRFDPYSPY